MEQPDQSLPEALRRLPRFYLLPYHILQRPPHSGIVVSFAANRDHVRYIHDHYVSESDFDIRRTALRPQQDILRLNRVLVHRMATTDSSIPTTMIIILRIILGGRRQQHEDILDNGGVLAI